ncbi:antibiotic biosynthesis monooxygenase [Cellulomonas fimi]|uniref:Antibiotic biosynthesis monooxygenase n=1 Tax=Cellulomonas fimi TaxID=1708 RepID=A0A7Y0QHL5_CELFI|nr:antibiotic biosynthesis monooxygenase [Cellulomonas fimi]
MASDAPVLEHGVLSVRPGQSAAFEAALAQALPLIRAARGFRGIDVRRCHERPDTYLLLVAWDSLEDHTEGFRGSPAFEEWRALTHHFYDPMPVIEHFTPMAGGTVAG